MKIGHTFALTVSVTMLVGTTHWALAQSASDVSVAEEANSSSTIRPRTIYQWVEPSAQKQGAISNIMYLNNCLPNGCQLRPGDNDSRTNTSTVVQSPATLRKWSYTPAVWTKVVQCVRETFAPFNIKIVDVDPGNVRHMEVMVAGSPGDIGLPNGVGGVAPFSCGYSENSISYAFANVYGGIVNEICATTAQEVAHTWGLDHVVEASDPMTYNPYNGRRKFKDAPVSCGSDCQGGQGPFGDVCQGQKRNCTCDKLPTQNSVQQIKGIFGTSTPVPPVVKITTPRDGDSVQEAAPVRISVTAELELSKAELRIDGTVTKTLTSQPFAFNLPVGLAGGKHTLEVTVYDIFDLPGKASIEVTSAGPCGGPSDCSANQTCVNGTCVAGPGSQGGLGEVCEVNADCASGTCGDGGAGMKYCVEACAIGQSGQCPTGFDCLAAGSNGVCWPNGDSTEESPPDTCGSCASSADSTALPVSFGLMFAGFLFTRRRRL
jgi:MYXO-CTERM domain-containing protein